MFDVGFTEIILITVIGLLVIGPDKLPAVARTLGGWFGQLQRFVNSTKAEIKRELDAAELRDILKEQEQEISKLKSMVDDVRGDTELESLTDEVNQHFEAAQQTIEDDGAQLSAADTSKPS